jgi:hypothetical protein
MSYVHKVINSSERIILIARPHWVYMAQGVLSAALLIGTGLAINYLIQSYINPDSIFMVLFLGFFAMAGAVLFVTYVIIYFASEVGLTNQRIIYKKGFLRIEVEEIDLEEIRGEIVHYGLLGWLLGYGRIHLDCRYADDIELPALAKPYQLLRSIHKAKFNHPKIDYGREQLDHHMKQIDSQHKTAQQRKVLNAFRTVH